MFEGLPEQYNTIRTVLREQDSLNFAQAVAKLETREEEIKGSMAKDSGSTNGEKPPKAFMTGGNKKQSRSKKLKCYHCGRKDHIKRD